MAPPAVKPSDNAAAARMHRNVGAAETDDECDIENLDLENVSAQCRKAIARKKLDMAVHDEL